MISQLVERQSAQGTRRLAEELASTRKRDRLHEDSGRGPSSGKQ